VSCDHHATQVCLYCYLVGCYGCCYYCCKINFISFDLNMNVVAQSVNVSLFDTL